MFKTRAQAAAAAFAVLLLASAAGAVQTRTAIRTIRSSYSSREPVVILGSGFSPFESVGLRVIHADGGAEAGGGHEWSFVQANALGSFRAVWVMSSRDGGVEFKVEAAAGSSGARAETAFRRTGVIRADRPSYTPGDKAHIVADGFNPNELVVVHANDGHDHELLATQSDADGRIAAEIALPADEPTGHFTITAKGSESDLAMTLSTAPLAGRVVYHSYVSYNDGSSQLFTLNLGSGVLTNISHGWTNLQDPMNAHWSPDGSKIVFMARPKKGNKASLYFDIFLYTIGGSGNPIDLTNTPSLHDEDPKFSPDGTKIVYKVRPSTLNEMDLSGRLLNSIISTPGPERSMPYYTADGRSIWFASQPSSDRTQSSIHRIDLNGSNEVVAVDTPGVLDYYPVRDVVGQFLYTRWSSPTNLHDQIYMFDGSAGVSLPFNTSDADYSDAAATGPQYVVLSSTKSGGRGGYDLYLADRNTGAMWSLSSYNSGVNTSREELGASYTPN
jgi:hypothetical protein